MAMTNAQIAALYQVTFPINFVANGDTVHIGFYKHIQEIDRIYGLLAGLERSKVTSSDLAAMLSQFATAGDLANYVTIPDFNNHINSSNPHPNLDLGNTKGNIPVSRVSGNWDLSKVTGQLAAGNIDMTGLISALEGNAGFANWVRSLAGGGGSGVGISDFNVGSNDGYIEFANGALIQFGKVQISSYPGSTMTYRSATATFPKAFTQQPFAVFAGNASFGGNGTSAPDMAFVSGYSTTAITLNSVSIVTATWLAAGK